MAKRQKRPASGFGARLRAERERLGLTQTELGERSGMAPQAVSRLEAGAVEPNWPTALALADALGVELTVFRLTQPSPPPGDGKKGVRRPGVG